MNKLLSDAIEAHGGADRWKQAVTIEADVVAAGQLHEGKGSQSPSAFHFVLKAHEQACVVTNASVPDRRSVFRPDHIVVETLKGQFIAERHEPRLSFAGHNVNTPWDPIQRSYFGSYAMWSYLTTPFSLATEGSQVWDVDPIEEDGEVWRGIRVVLPSRFATHCRAQEFYFGEDMLLRRQDYSFDLAEGIRIANYALDIVDIDGIKLPSRRRAYLCNKRYDVLRERLMVRLDLSNLRVSDESGAPL